MIALSCKYFLMFKHFSLNANIGDDEHFYKV